MAVQLAPKAHEKIQNIKLSTEAVKQEIKALSEWIDLHAPEVVPEVTKERARKLTMLTALVDELLLELERLG